MIGKVREDIKREEQTQKSLKKAIDQERETRKKKDRENAELKQSLDIMNDKAEIRKSEIDRRLVETQKYYEEIKESTRKEKVKIQNIRSQLKDMGGEVRNEIHSLELANAEAIGFLDELKKKTEYDRLAKNERLKSIKQKSKLLATLISQDSSSPKSIPAPRVGQKKPSSKMGKGK